MLWGSGTPVAVGSAATLNRPPAPQVQAPGEPCSAPLGALPLQICPSQLQARPWGMWPEGSPQPLPGRTSALLLSVTIEPSRPGRGRAALLEDPEVMQGPSRADGSRGTGPSMSPASLVWPEGRGPGHTSVPVRGGAANTAVRAERGSSVGGKGCTGSPANSSRIIIYIGSEH